ncbi:MAG TPA: phosphatidate cytidylyltransferase [Anaerolineales bacterium]|nr:phosphatidate cytidylyltransferase [Anaerolineales bacterium]
MLKRTLTSLGFAAVGLPAIIFGGVFYYLLIAVILTGSAWEYVRLFRAVRSEPHEIVTVGSVLAIATVRFFFPEAAIPLFGLLVLLAMGIHVVAYERGRDRASIDFAVTVAGIVYLGWLGSYLIDLRQLPQGLWWLMLVLPIVWGGDTGAYTIGVRYGKHKMTPRLSPNKSWEGYFAGVFTSVAVGAFFAYAFSSLDPKPLGGLINAVQGGFLGLVIGALAPLGDLGESMFKRQGGLKDSSNIFPGHGGFFDRIDSWIWGAALGYFLIQLFIL